MTNKHTPGPWRIEEDFAVENLSDPTYLKIKGSHLICKLQVCDDADIRREQEANARLIAAAPELLEACKLAAQYVAKMVADDVQTAMPPQIALDRIEQAITNATKS